MKTLLFALFTLLAPSAQATPGDVGCSALVDGQRLEILLGLDQFGQTTPSLIWIDLDGKRVGEFREEQISGRIGGVVKANGGPGNNLILAFVEGNPGAPEAFLTIYLEKARLSGSGLRMKCER